MDHPSLDMGRGASNPPMSTDLTNIAHIVLFRGKFTESIHPYDTLRSSEKYVFTHMWNHGRRCVYKKLCTWVRKLRLVLPFVEFLILTFSPALQIYLNNVSLPYQTINHRPPPRLHAIKYMKIQTGYRSLFYRGLLLIYVPRWNKLQSKWTPLQHNKSSTESPLNVYLKYWF